MIPKAELLLAGVFLLSALTSVPARSAGLGELMLSADEGSETSQTVFQPQTPKIVLEAELVDMPEGTRVRADWIAERTGVAPPDYKIDSAEITANSQVNMATFSLSRPDAGWPAGDYRVNLYIDGKPDTTVTFTIKE